MSHRGKEKKKRKNNTEIKTNVKSTEQLETINQTLTHTQKKNSVPGKDSDVFFFLITDTEISDCCQLNHKEKSSTSYTSSCILAWIIRLY